MPSSTSIVEKNIHANEFISLPKIRNLSQKLPPCAAKWTLGNATFEVYQAKEIFNTQWQDSSLQTLAEKARSSYDRYGAINTVDIYDKKSAVYLARASYLDFSTNSQGEQTEEWISLRFVPGKGVPLGTPDLRYFRCYNRPLSQVIQKKLFRGSSTFLTHMVEISKLCSIAPYTKERRKKSEPSIPPKLRYTAILFALINKQFLEDYIVSKKLSVSYISGIFRNELIEKSLTLHLNAGVLGPSFTPASSTLNIKNPSRNLRLNRSMIAYQFPTYFLRIDQLEALIKRLLKNQKLTRQTLIYYLGNTGGFWGRSNNATKRIFQLKTLGNLLTVKGKIKHSPLTGQQLRTLINKEVADGPELKITQAEVWKRSIEDFLKLADIKAANQ